MRRGYNHPDNTLRASVVADPQFARKNTKDNTPAVISVQIVPGSVVDVTVAAKGGGSENKSKMVMMNPSDNLVDWVLKTVPTMGAGWCPPGMLGIGIGGTAEKAVLLAKESLMEDLDMYELQAKAARGEKLDQVEELRLSCTRRSTRWASARKAWAAWRPCWTSRSRCTPRTPPASPWP